MRRPYKWLHKVHETVSKISFLTQETTIAVTRHKSHFWKKNQLALSGVMMWPYRTLALLVGAKNASDVVIVIYNRNMFTSCLINNHSLYRIANISRTYVQLELFYESVPWCLLAVTLSHDSSVKLPTCKSSVIFIYTCN